MSEQPVIPMQRIRVGTIYVNGRTGQITLEDLTANDDFQDLRVLLDVVSSLHAVLERKLTEQIIRSHEPIGAISEALKDYFPTAAAPIVESLVLQVLEAQAQRRRQAPGGSGVVLAPPGARVRSSGG